MFSVSVVVVFCGFMAGLLIGAVGIGGVILVPLLVYMANADIHQSIAAALFSFSISGIVGTIIYARRGVIEWALVRNLVAGAVPGTLAGTVVLQYINETALIAGIASLAILSAGRELLPTSGHRQDIDYAIRPLHLITVGAVTGALSALSGTGGPMILIPVLIWFSVPAVMAIGLAQVIQLPIAIVATSGNIWNDTLDWHMGAAIAVGVAAGTLIGGIMSKHIPAVTLKKGVALLLVVSGLLMFFSIIW